MKEQLISFDVAKLAKEKGFDFSEIEIRDSNTLEVADNVEARLDYFGTMEESNLIQLPTQSLLQKWLREKHDIHIEVTPEYQENYWRVNITILPAEEWLLPGLTKEFLFDTYEEALEKGLQEALKLIK